ncbi:MAG TPA: DUF4180 domain-containing protein [Anaerolineales bacterium]|nr:DUF4180 domain-containing protein [Anaerolineales bacterium]
MTYQVIQKNGTSIVACQPGQALISSEREALDWVGLCGELGSDRLLLFGDNLTPEFFDLKTGVAGAILLKFANYRLKLALVTEADKIATGRFGEMAREANRRNGSFHIFSEQDGAVDWLAER